MSLGGFLSGALVEAAGFGGVFLVLAAGTGLIGLVAVPRLRGAGLAPVAGRPPAPSMRAIVTGPVLTVGAIVMFVAAAYGSVIFFVPLLMASAGLPAGRVGIVFGVGTAASLLVLPYAGHLADRAGRRRAMVGGLLAYVAAIFTLGYAQGFWPILVVTTVMFVSRWASDPAMVALLSDVVPPAFQGRAQG